MDHHVDHLSHEELEALARDRGQPCISIFMPTFQAAVDVKQNPIRLKDLLKEAERGLTARGMRSPDAMELLAPAYDLSGRSEFWEKQSDGLAVFVSRDLFRYYRLPVKFQDRAVVNNRFYIKPLLSVLHDDGTFYILALDQKDIRLLQGSRDSIVSVPLEELHVPRSMAEALPNEEFQAANQMHSFPNAEPNSKYGQTAILHGEGITEDPKSKIRRFFQKVDDGLRNSFGDGKAPLVLAGVEYLIPIYKEVNSYPTLAEKPILGNTKSLSAQELHDRAWPIVEPMYRMPLEKDRDLYRQFMGEKDKRASNDLKVIVPAAFYGRVATLFVDRDSQMWGTFDPATEELSVHPERKPQDDDLLDLASLQTILNDGTVYALERDQMPDKSPIAAVFRY
jgi:hypothetical protein